MSLVGHFKLEVSVVCGICGVVCVSLGGVVCVSLGGVVCVSLGGVVCVSWVGWCVSVGWGGVCQLGGDLYVHMYTRICMFFDIV